MGSTFDKLLSENLLNTPPFFLKNNIHYEVITGSKAYGCENPGKSDIDIYGFGIPPKDVIFPHLKGLVHGFDVIPMFNQFQQHHINHNSGIEYDITIYNIVQFISLCMENNPNMIDALFPSRECVLFTTRVGEHVRDNANMFLTRHAYHKFNGYAHSQLGKMQSKKINEFIYLCKKYDLSYDIGISDIPSRLTFPIAQQLEKLILEIDKDGHRTKRVHSIAKYGYDLKFAYHLVRLQSECEQILTNHTLVLNRDREIYKSIRRGEWTKEQVIDHFNVNEKRLKKIYDESTLRDRPNVDGIRNLLLNCLEMHYGSLEECVATLNKHEIVLREIKQLIINNKI